MPDRDHLADLPPEEQEIRVLSSFTQFHGLTRDWFAVELREAFDRVLANSLIEPITIYRLTDAGCKLLFEASDKRLKELTGRRLAQFRR